MAQISKRLSRRLTVSAVSLLFGTAAHGSYYPANADPGGTGTVPGWNGTAVFEVDPGCLPADFVGWLPTYQNPTAPCEGCGNASVFSANINLYSTDTNDPPTPGVVLGTITLGNFGNTENADFNIWGVYDVNGALEGVDTLAMGPVSGSSTPTATYSDDNFWLQFVSGYCPGNYDASCPYLGQQLDASAYLFFNGTTSGDTSNPATVTFGSTACSDPNNCTLSTPEPGTLGLILGALGGGWLARRRKANTAVKSP